MAKPGTPLTQGISFPNFDENLFSDLVKSRIRLVYLTIREEIGVAPSHVWIYGSHVRGISRSGNPDIDLCFYDEKIVKLFGMSRIRKKMCQIRQKIPFSLDLTFANYTRCEILKEALKLSDAFLEK
jgi:predicted nucleotidyltransferase